MHPHCCSEIAEMHDAEARARLDPPLRASLTTPPTIAAARAHAHQLDVQERHATPPRNPHASLSRPSAAEDTAAVRITAILLLATAALAAR